MLKHITLVLLVLSLTAPSFAQSPEVKAPETIDIPEPDVLKLENLQLRFQLAMVNLQKAQADAEAARAATQAQFMSILKSHGIEDATGWRIDFAAKKLIKDPDPVKKPDA